MDNDNNMRSANEQHIQQNNQESGMAITALVLGLIAFVVGLVPLFGWFMFPLAVLAIVFGALALQKKQSRAQAIAGIALGAGWGVWKIGFWVMLGIFSTL